MKYDESSKAAVGWTLGLCAAAAFATADSPDFFAVHGVVARKVLDMGAHSTAKALGRGSVLQPTSHLTSAQACFSPTLA